MTPARPEGHGAGWDPEVLARIQALAFQARVLVAGFLHGAHRSTRVAHNVEFADYKDYTPGDPLRDLDWRVLARSDRLVVRRHHAEHELPVTLVVDASADAGTGEAGRWPRGGRPPLTGSKWGAAAVLAATVAWWLRRRGEPVGLAVVAGESVPWRWLPPRTGRAHAAAILGTLAAAVPAGRADLGTALPAIGARLPRRSMVVLISDLMEEPATWAEAVAGLGAGLRDLRVVHLHDPREWTLDYPAAARFRSPEGGRPLVVDPAGARDAMAEVVADYLAEVRAAMVRAGARHVLAPSDGALSAVVARLLREG